MPAADADDDEPELEPEAISRDHALTLFLRRPPAAADHFVVTAFATTGDHVVQDRSAAECREDPVQLANDTIEGAERFAKSEGREMRFRATWQAGDRVLASHQWSCGEGDPRALDGTVESLLAQQQRHAEADHRLHHDGFAMVQEGWRDLNLAQKAEIAELRKECHELRERLRKVGDLETEIAAAEAASNLEQRSRTADILENRVLPIVQGLAMKYLEQGAAAQQLPAPPAHLEPGNKQAS